MYYYIDLVNIPYLYDWAFKNNITNNSHIGSLYKAL